MPAIFCKACNTLLEVPRNYPEPTLPCPKCEKQVTLPAKWRQPIDPSRSTEDRPLTSAVRAGWICLAIGGTTFWVFGIGLPFLAVAFICAVVALCTHQVREGLLLLCSTISVVVIATLLMQLLFLAVISKALEPFTQRSSTRTSWQTR